MTDTLFDRAMAKVRKSETCWEWTGGLDKDGYGMISARRTTLRAHRVIYEAMVGPIPAGLQIDHLCRVRNCVNPAHLEPVTPRENVLRSSNPPARNAAKTECANGHPFDAENTYQHPSGGRVCRICSRAAWRRYHARRQMSEVTP